jgi:hypothetical protein
LGSTEEGVSDSKENGEGVSESAKRQTDEAYYEEMLHFLPALVDVSAIQAPIVSVACGNQHSMILAGMKKKLFNSTVEALNVIAFGPRSDHISRQ